MPPHTPFVDADAEDEPSDRDLVDRARDGDRAALEALLARHQPWIYNLAFRMVLKPQDAEDVAQEVMIKIVTRLATFDPEKAAFRTWLYRVVANHVINMRSREFEANIKRIEDYYGFVTAVADEDPAGSPDARRIAEDLAIGCTMGVLLCLDRRQRLAFVLSAAFGVTDVQGGEILEVSREAFRKLLSRARAKLRAYVGRHCGVVDPEAPCRCANKVGGLVRLGAYRDGRLDYLPDARTPTLAETVGRKLEHFDREIYPDYVRVLRAQPFYDAPRMTAWLADLVRRPDFEEVFDL